jgi:hypothetical protein
MPEVEMWTFNILPETEGPVEQLALNLGAPGDRRGPDGALWLEYPVVGGPSPPLPVSVQPEQPDWFRHHSSRVTGDALPWVAASGAKGLESVTLVLDEAGAQERRYDVALHFMEPDAVQPGDRVFDVMLQGEVALAGLDVLEAAGARNRGVVKTFPNVRVQGRLLIELRPSPAARAQAPVLSGIAVTVRD